MNLLLIAVHYSTFHCMILATNVRPPSPDIYPPFVVLCSLQDRIMAICVRGSPSPAGRMMPYSWCRCRHRPTARCVYCAGHYIGANHRVTTQHRHVRPSLVLSYANTMQGGVHKDRLIIGAVMSCHAVSVALTFIQCAVEYIAYILAAFHDFVVMPCGYCRDMFRRSTRLVVSFYK